MHLHHPALSLNGRRKGKVKFRTAAQAQQARENADAWQELLKRHEVKQQASKRRRAMNAAPYVPKPLSYRGSELPRIPSRETTWEPCSKPAEKVYTGSKMIGIGTMHKSNCVPIFSDEEAENIAHMRR